MTHQAQSINTQKLTFQALLLALALILQWLEFMLPPLPVPAPVKLGLSNLVIMYAICYTTPRTGFVLACLKGLFAFFIRGLLAGALSFGGGVVAFLTLLILHRLFGARISWLLLSGLGGVTHNLGQLLVLVVLMPFITILSMLPILLLIGLASGIVCGLLFYYTIPPFQAIQKQITKGNIR